MHAYCLLTPLMECQNLREMSTAFVEKDQWMIMRKTEQRTGYGTYQVCRKIRAIAS